MAQKRTWGGSIRAKVYTVKQSIDLRDMVLERYPGRLHRAGRWL
jgi:hypothetical protein